MYLKFLNILSKNVVEKKYIQNGLVFHLDGIDTGGIAGVWEDKIGGIKFTLGSTTQYDNDGFVFDGTVNSGCVSSSGIDFIATDNAYTIEIVMKRDTDGASSQYVFFGGASSEVFFVTNNQMLTIRRTSNTRYNVGTLANLSSVSATHFVCYVNKVLQTTNGNDYWNTSLATACIGFVQGTSSRFFKGKICCIRVYNRNLTDQEILYNQDLDIERFGITI